MLIRMSRCEDCPFFYYIIYPYETEDGLIVFDDPKFNHVGADPNGTNLTCYPHEMNAAEPS